MRKVVLLLMLALPLAVFGQVFVGGNGGQKAHGHWTNVSLGVSSEKTPIGYNKKGQMPPCWLKNKVSKEQYDTLTALNMLADVDYGALKGYNVSNSDVESFMTQAKKAIYAFTESSDGKYVKQFTSESSSTFDGVPYSRAVGKKQTEAKYLAYSSIDGYDAHVLITLSLVKNKTTKGYTASGISYEGYSLSGVPVTVDVRLQDFKERKEITSIDIPKDGISEQYSLFGTIEFTDPLGCHHKERVKRTVQFGL